MLPNFFFSTRLLDLHQKQGEMLPFFFQLDFSELYQKQGKMLPKFFLSIRLFIARAQNTANSAQFLSTRLL